MVVKEVASKIKVKNNLNNFKNGEGWRDFGLKMNRDTDPGPSKHTFRTTGRLRGSGPKIVVRFLHRLKFNDYRSALPLLLSPDGVDRVEGF